VDVQSSSAQSGSPTNGYERPPTCSTALVAITLMYETLPNKETEKKGKEGRHLSLL
jgi:hypothetical protein